MSTVQFRPVAVICITFPIAGKVFLGLILHHRISTGFTSVLSVDSPVFYPLPWAMDLKKFAANAYKKAAANNGKKPASDPPGLVKQSSSDSGSPQKPVTKPSPKPGVPAQAGQTPGQAARTAKVQALFQQAGEKGPSKTEIAKYMLVIGPDQASQILKHLPEDAVEAIIQEISRIDHLQPKERDEILAKFDYLFATTQPKTAGGVDTARGFLVQAFGSEKGEQLLRQALPEQVFKHFQFMEEYEPQQIHTLLKHEGFALRALVLSHLNPTLAAGVIKLMPREDQLDIIRRLSKMEKLDREVLISVEEAMKERIRKIGTVQASEVDGKGVLAEILKHMDAKSETTLLEFLDDEDPILGSDIKERLFTIDTLLAIEDRDLQRILQEIENSKLALIMKGKSEEIRRKILTNLSQSRAELVIDEYQYMGPKRRSEIDEVTRDLVRYLKKLEEQGKLVVRRENEEYI